MLKLFFLYMLFLGLIFSCKKEPVIGTTPTSVQQPQITTLPPSPVNLLNIAPNVFAGSEIYIAFPVNSCTLKGSAQYTLSIKTILWNKISGPVSFVIENPGSFETNVHDLEKGTYEFELTVTDKAGLTGKDTVSVSVNEIIFKDRQWVCPMGCHIRIENFRSFAPIGTAFKVYVKRDQSAEWVEAININQGFSKYSWFIYNNGLEILEDQTEYPGDTPDVKIVF